MCCFRVVRLSVQMENDPCTTGNSLDCWKIVVMENRPGPGKWWLEGSWAKCPLFKTAVGVVMVDDASDASDEHSESTGTWFSKSLGWLCWNVHLFPDTMAAESCACRLPLVHLPASVGLGRGTVRMWFRTVRKCHGIPMIYIQFVAFFSGKMMINV